MPDYRGLRSRRVEATDSLDDINDLYYNRGWTDGLPIVPPTEERVFRMLQTVDRDPGEIIGKFPPMGLVPLRRWR